MNTGVVRSLEDHAVGDDRGEVASVARHVAARVPTACAYDFEPALPAEHVEPPVEADIERRDPENHRRVTSGDHTGCCLLEVPAVLLLKALLASAPLVGHTRSVTEP